MSELPALVIDHRQVFQSDEEAFKFRMQQVREYQKRGYSAEQLADWLVKQTCFDYDNIERKRSVMLLVVSLSYFGALGLFGYGIYRLTLFILGALS